MSSGNSVQRRVYYGCVFLPWKQEREASQPSNKSCRRTRSGELQEVIRTVRALSRTTKGNEMKSTAFKFSTMASAKAFQARANDIMMIVLGDNDQFWAVTPSDAARLVRGGYELAE